MTGPGLDKVQRSIMIGETPGGICRLPFDDVDAGADYMMLATRSTNFGCAGQYPMQSA